MFVRRLASQIGQASPPFSPSPQLAYGKPRCRPSTSRCQSKHKASNRWAGAYLLTARDAGLGMLAKPQGPLWCPFGAEAAGPNRQVQFVGPGSQRGLQKKFSVERCFGPLGRRSFGAEAAGPKPSQPSDIKRCPVWACRQAQAVPKFDEL